MALTLNQMVRERRKVLLELKRKLRLVDSSLEMIERYQDRILARKNKLPEATDLQYISTALEAAVKLMTDYNKTLSAGYVE